MLKGREFQTVKEEGQSQVTTSATSQEVPVPSCAVPVFCTLQHLQNVEPLPVSTIACGPRVAIASRSDILFERDHALQTKWLCIVEGHVHSCGCSPPVIGGMLGLPTCRL